MSWSVFSALWQIEPSSDDAFLNFKQDLEPYSRVCADSILVIGNANRSSWLSMNVRNKIKSTYNEYGFALRNTPKYVLHAFIFNFLKFEWNIWNILKKSRCLRFHVVFVITFFDDLRIEDFKNKLTNSFYYHFFINSLSCDLISYELFNKNENSTIKTNV